MKKATLARKSLAAILTLAMLLGMLSMLPITVGAAESALGTASNPILIGSTSDLNNLATTIGTATPDADGTYYVEFTKDIDYNGGTITKQSLVSYTVHIDGKGYTVKNYNASFGIIYNLGDNSTIQNLHATGVNITCGSTQVGAILGYARDGFTMKNCSAEGTLVNTKTSTTITLGIGGLVGAIEQGEAMTPVIIEDCVNNVTVTAPALTNAGVGGIVGKVDTKYSNVVIHGCTNNKPIHGGSGYAGGIIGRVLYARDLTVDECVNNGEISTDGYAAGGMLGYGIAYGEGERWTFERDVNDAPITASQYVGGIAGYASGYIRPRFAYSGNEGTLTATASSNAYVGGMLGYGSVTGVLNSLSIYFGYDYNIGTIVANGAATTGGVFGYLSAVNGNTVDIPGFYDDATRTLSGTLSGKHGLLIGSLANCTTNSTKDLKLRSSSAVKQANVSKLHNETVALLEDTSSVLTESSASILATRQRSAGLRKPDGAGSKNDPYLIGSAEQLGWFAGHADDFDEIVYAELTANVDYGGQSLSINFLNADRNADGGEYVGREVHFDGNGYTISNYTSRAGIFDYVGAGCVIQNLNVSNATITNNDANRFTGTIVGSATGHLTMLNCTATNSTVTVNKSGTHTGGGLIGGILESSGAVTLIANCHNDGVTVKTNDTAAGGILGTITATTFVAITDCTNSGTISSTAATTGVGGILGQNHNAANGVSIYNCTNTGTIGSASETASAGGIVGYAKKAVTVKSSRNEGKVSAATNAGGIVGSAAAAVTVEASANVGTITAGTAAGAILGASTSTTTITNSYNEGTAADGLTTATATTTDWYDGVANRDAAVKAIADTRIDTTTAGRKMSVRIKLTDNFGLMAITYLGAVAGSTAKTIADYDEVGFYFLQNEGTVTPDDVLKSGTKVAGASYNGSTTRFAAAYATVTPTELDRDLHFVAYAKKGDVEVLSTVRTVDIQSFVVDLSDDGCLGAQKVTTNQNEIRLYQGMLRYSAVYENYVSRELKIGTVNLMQNHFSRSATSYTDRNASNATANLERQADTMYALDLDILGLNEVNMYRGTESGAATNYGGYNEPWEIARMMEEKTGEEYYWAFASAVDRNGTAYNRYASATGTAGVNYPDGGYYSGDNVDARKVTTIGYGEGIVSKYPIVNWECKDIYADHIGSNWSSNADMSGQERRVILVVQLDIDGKNDGKGDIITVMVGHFASTYSATAQTAAVAAVTALEEKYGDTPIFFMGDLNMPRDRAEIEDIDAVLNRAGNDNMTPTFRSGSKIDYIYYSNDIEVTSYDVASRRHVASDHYPVYVTARVTRTQFG